MDAKGSIVDSTTWQVRVKLTYTYVSERIVAITEELDYGSFQMTIWRREIRTLDGDGALMRVVKLKLEDETYDTTGTSTYDRSTEGIVVKTDSSKSDSGWAFIRRLTSVYDGGTLVADSSSYVPEGSDLVPTAYISYSYNTEGAVDTVTTFAKGSDGWTPEQRTVYAYGTTGFVTARQGPAHVSLRGALEGPVRVHTLSGRLVGVMHTASPDGNVPIGEEGTVAGGLGAGRLVLEGAGPQKAAARKTIVKH